MDNVILLIDEKDPKKIRAFSSFMALLDAFPEWPHSTLKRRERYQFPFNFRGFDIVKLTVIKRDSNGN